jgi:Domain of unknown function (DUF4276)
MMSHQRRMVCVVEGKGEVEAIPNLCTRILIALGVWDWSVDSEPIRQPRSCLVDGRVKSPMRPARDELFDRAVQLALRSRRADGVLVLCDSDDDCPAAWGPSALARLAVVCRGAAVMAQREYETWILHGLEQAADLDPKLVEGRRDAKGLLRRYYPGYRPSLHQLAVTRELDIERCWARSDSFDKLVRSIAALTGAPMPKRPVM